MGLSNKLDVISEGAWLLMIFLLPVYFNPLGYQAFYFAKALLLQFGACLLLGLYLARWFLERHERTPVNLLTTLRQSPLQAVAVVFGLVWAVSTTFSIMPEASLWGSLARKNGLISIISLIALFLIVSEQMRKRSQVCRALGTLVLSSAVVSLTGILLIVFPQVWEWSSFSGRVASTDGNPLSLSAFLAMVLPVNLALVMMAWSGTGAILKKAVKLAGLLLALALQMTCLCLAQYSITILLFVPGMFLFVLLLGIFLKRRAIVAFGVLALLSLSVLATLLLGQLMLTPTETLPAEKPTQADSMAERVGLNTLDTRVNVWRSTLSIIMDSPEVPFYQDNYHALRWLTGYGPEMLVVVSQTRFPTSLKSEYTYNSILLGQPENHYLYLAATIGLLGLAAFLAVLLICFYLGLRLLCKFPGKDVIYLTSALIAGVAQYCIHILFNPTAILPEFMFWLILAMMAALARLEMAGDGETAAPADNGLRPMGTVKKADNGKFRKSMAGLIVILFIGVGFSLTFSPALADMKLNNAVHTWSSDKGKAMSAVAEAAKLEPREAVYFGYIGSYAFYLAIHSDNATERSELLALSTLAYRAAVTCEPYMAYWSYTIADVYTYWANHGAPDKWQDALDNYERANRQLPGDAVILNKWALALMLEGDYVAAGQKLQEAERNDPSWVQTTYFKGLLELYEHCFCSTGYAFVYPLKEKLSNAAQYVSFCSQLALYGGIEKVVEGLKVYTGCHGEDWEGQTLLGIANVYDNRLEEASTALHKAAELVPDEEIDGLKGIIKSLPEGSKNFKPALEDILYRLEERVDK
jgi:O-antigen ligase